MMMYALYRIGYFLANRLPLNIAYSVACAIADIRYYTAGREKRAIIENLKVVFGDRPIDEKKLEETGILVFRNFAKYLVDFFRFSKLNSGYIKTHVKVEGVSNVDKCLSRGKGAIVLSAHIGNWELGGSALSMVGYPVNAVVMTHKNKKVNDFFTRQRLTGSVRPIEIGATLRICFKTLKNNGILALLGDRDFSKSGMRVKFFGKETLMPKGPAAFSYKLGSGIVPCFMVRERGDTFRLVFEEPIFPDCDGPEEAAVKKITERYLPVIESYIKRYPDQWYMFREVWNHGGKANSGPHTVI